MMMGSGEIEHEFNMDDLIDENDNNPTFVAGSDISLAAGNMLDEPDDSLSFFNVIPDTQYPAKSPWHESDSGVSDIISFAGSPIDFNSSVVEETASKSKLAFPKKRASSNAPSIKISESDHELMNYLNGVEVEEKDHHTNKSNSSGRPIRKCTQKNVTVKIVAPDSEDTNCVLPAIETQKKYVSIQPLSFHNEASSFNSRSDIKIVKVVKPPACSTETTDEDIMKALDDRSKKNAQQAKINREKKKAYISSLENENDNLRKENKMLMSQNGKMQKDVSCLEEEIVYLKSVLVNASALSDLLKNINNVKEVKLSATLSGYKRAALEDDHSYNIVESVPMKRARLVKENLQKAGVCLHVSEGEACLEFCAHCSSLAQKTRSQRGKGNKH